MIKRLAALLLFASCAHGQMLEESTAVTILIGPLVSTSDASPQTGLTVSQADVRLSKNGGNMAQKNESSACTHDELGMYACALDTTDTNTIGALTISVNDGGNALVWSKTYDVVSAEYMDVVNGTDDLPALISAVLGGSTSEPSSIPAATAGRGVKIDWIFTQFRNRLTQDGSEQCLYADNESTQIACWPTTDDGATFTRGEMASP